MRRMTWIASSSASTASLGVGSGPPIAPIASQKAPAPRPSSKRPPDRRSIVAAAFAITAGGLSGRFVTSGEKRILLVRAARDGISDHVSRERRWDGGSWVPTGGGPGGSAPLD